MVIKNTGAARFWRTERAAQNARHGITRAWLPSHIERWRRVAWRRSNIALIHRHRIAYQSSGKQRHLDIMMVYGASCDMCDVW